MKGNKEMNYHDFEKYNGKMFGEFISINNEGYGISNGTIDGIDVTVHYEEDLPEADVRLSDGTLIGHGMYDEVREDYVFNASNQEWT